MDTVVSAAGALFRFVVTSLIVIAGAGVGVGIWFIIAWAISLFLPLSLFVYGTGTIVACVVGGLYTAETLNGGKY